MNDMLMVFAAVPLLLLASAAAAAPQAQEPSQEQVQEVERSPQTYVYSDPETPPAQETDADTGSAADKERRNFEQQLWDMFGRGEYDAVRRSIAERRQKEPGWQPPDWLTVELGRAGARAKIADAKNDPKALIALHRRYPELFNCREYYHLWSLADAQIAVEEPSIASRIHHQILASCLDSTVLLTTLDRIADGEGPSQALAGAAQVEKRAQVQLPMNELEQRRFGWRVNHAVALRKEGRLEEAGHHLAAVENTVMKRRDVGLGRLIAWNYRERNEAAAATSWFERVVQWSGDEEDRVNLLQHQWNTGERAKVIDSLRHRPVQAPKARRWAAEVLRGEAARVFDERAYADSVALLDAALIYDKPEPASLASLRGWACLELKRFTDAHNAFADAYRDTQDAGHASGLLYAAQRGGDWNALLAVADSVGGPLLATEGERALAVQLAEGRMNAAQVDVAEGRLVEVEGMKTSNLTRLVQSLEGIPGYTWGSVDRDSEGDISVSYLINQGVDWVKLPGDIIFSTFVEYRAIDNSWQYFRDETEGALGLEFRRYPFRLGVEYLNERWRNGDGARDTTHKAYFSWYDDWYQFLRRRRGGGANPLDVDAYAGSTYGRITHDLDGDEGTSILGFVKQGVDWFTFSEDVTLHSYVAYRFRFRDWNNYWYDAHGPAIGIELQKTPFTLGVDYAWQHYPEQNSSSTGASIYLNWYYGWDLKAD